MGTNFLPVLKLDQLIEDPALNASLNESEKVINVKIIEISDHDSNESEDIEGHEQPNVVVGNWGVSCIQIVNDQSDAVNSGNSAKLDYRELKAILEHATKGEIPDGFLDTNAPLLHLEAILVIYVIGLLMIPEIVHLVRLDLFLIFVVSYEVIEP